MPLPGRKSVTISEKKYEDLRAFANKKDFSVAEMAEFLIDQYSRPYVRAVIDVTTKGGGWQEAYEDIVLDPKIKHYDSTGWIRTREYINNVGSPLFTIDRRVREDPTFCVEKMFIFSKNSWTAKEVWDWTAYWLALIVMREERFRIFIIKEKDAIREKIPEIYYDMGIYGEAREAKNREIITGFLYIDEKSKPGPYRRFSSRDSPEEIKLAEENFEKLKKIAKPMKTFEDFERLRKQPYDD